MGIIKPRIESVTESIFNIKPSEDIKIDFITDNSVNTKRYMIIRSKDSEKIIIPLKFNTNNMSLPVAIWETLCAYVNNHYNINCTGTVSCLTGEIRKYENEYELDDIVRWDNYPYNSENALVMPRNLTMVELPEGMTESEAKKILENYKKKK